MGARSELQLALEEAVIAADAAVASAERLATHGILPSRDFESLIGFLREIQASLDRAKAEASHKMVIVKR